MPANATAVITTKVLSQAVDLLRVSEGLRQTILDDLAQLESDLIKDLQDTTGKTNFTVERLRALLVQTRQTINTAYGQIALLFPSELKEIAVAVSEQILKTVNGALRVDLLSVAMSKEQLEYIAGKTVVEGHFPAQFWTKQGQLLRDRFAATMRQGQYRGETVDQLVRRVRGTRDNAFTDGVMNASRRQAEALVRTSVIAVANEAKLRSYINNRDTIKGIEWVATLDERTCWSPETLVNMANGTRRPIGKIKRGDFVQGGITGKKCKVTSTFLSFENDVIAVYLDNGKRAGFTTREHRWLTENGWEQASHGVSADISEREVLCRSLVQRRQTVARASTKSVKREESRALQRDKKARQTKGDDVGCLQELPGSIRGRKATHRNDENDVPARLQHDGGRRGSGRTARGNQKSSRRETQATLSRRPGMQSKDSSIRQKIGAESFGGEQTILRDATRQSVNEAPVKIGVAEQRYQSQSEVEKPAHVAQDEHKYAHELERPDLLPESKRSAGTRAGGAQEQQPEMGCFKTKENCGCDAEEMARPRLSSEDGSAIRAGTITCRERKRRTAIVSLTIEGDKSYVAGGIIVHNTEICRGLNGKKWYLPESGDKDADYIPWGHDTPFPGATAHWNCRSVQVPITFSFKELAAQNRG